MDGLLLPLASLRVSIARSTFRPPGLAFLVFPYPSFWCIDKVFPSVFFAPYDTARGPFFCSVSYRSLFSLRDHWRHVLFREMIMFPTMPAALPFCISLVWFSRFPTHVLPTIDIALRGFCLFAIDTSLPPPIYR